MDFLLCLYSLGDDCLLAKWSMVYLVWLSGGEKDYKELMNKFHFVSNAFLALDKG